jgi:glyoxylase-like metal-dependent hydrolase (beta-lactamase superfamily II)
MIPQFRPIAAIFAVALLLMPPAAAEDGPPYEATEVADGVYSFRYHRHRNMFVVTTDGVIATDPISPPAAVALMGEIRKITDQPVRYVIYSHEHWDHVLGGQVFKDAGATFVSHAKCAAAFAAAPHPALVPPDETYEGARHDITLGGRTVELHHFGRSHGQCLSVMRVPDAGVLFTVDIVSPRRLPYRNMPDTFPLDWIRTLLAIEDTLEFRRIIPGHGPPWAPAAAVREQRAYLEDLIAAVTEAVLDEQDLDTLRAAVELRQYRDWAMYDEWLPMNVERIYYLLGMGL